MFLEIRCLNFRTFLSGIPDMSISMFLLRGNGGCTIAKNIYERVVALLSEEIDGCREKWGLSMLPFLESTNIGVFRNL